MRSIISRWFLFGLLVGWSLTHATVFGQTAGKDAKASAPADKLRQALDKTITVDFTGQSLAEVGHLRDKTGIAIRTDPAAHAQMEANSAVFPPGAPMQVQFQIKATNEKASVVLRRFFNAYELAYIVNEDAVLITTQELALMRQMRLRVSVDLEDVPLKKAVRELAKKNGINLVIDPKVAKQSETPVSLQLDNTGVETALRLLAEMASLKAVRMGNVMFITSEEKAKKIREEEQHQFDNPLNPNLPAMPQILGAGFGAAFGGIAMPPAPPVGLAPAPPLPFAPPPADAKPLQVPPPGAPPAPPPQIERPAPPPPPLPPQNPQDK